MNSLGVTDLFTKGGPFVPHCALHSRDGRECAVRVSGDQNASKQHACDGFFGWPADFSASTCTEYLVSE